MRKTLLAAALAAPLLASAATELVTNGSFEADKQAAGTWNIYNNLSGWTGQPNIELRNDVAGKAYDGKNFVELDTNANSRMTQQIDGAAGKVLLSFWYSARPGTPAGTDELKVWFDGVQVGDLLKNVGNYGNENNWLHFSKWVNFDGHAALTFEAAGRSDSYGAAIDKVSITTAVPEPESYALMLGGLAAIAFVVRRRRS